jgi:hypothetical protein
MAIVGQSGISDSVVMPTNQPNVPVPPANPTDPVKSGFLTSELWSFMAFLVKNAIILLVLSGKMQSADADQLNTFVMTLLGTAIVAGGEAYALVSYIKGRVTIKTGGNNVVPPGAQS